jgi:hypothetical protein
MAKTQLNVRLNPTTAEAARNAANSSHLSLNEYIEGLVLENTRAVRETFMRGALDFIAEFGDVIEEADRGRRR